MTDIDKTIEEAKADSMPFESWEQLPEEKGAAFGAFCAFRDLGYERNIRKAVEAVYKDTAVQAKKYTMWRNWSTQFRWRERAEDYDRYIENLKQGERRKTIEAQGEMHRKVTGQMLEVVSKKLDTMNAQELSQDNLSDWVKTAVKTDREVAGLVTGNGKPELKQGELNFVTDFQGL